MTCYETLRAPTPAADAPMAHHFVKWWRNKFRNGYKKFSIGTESDRTDTEELVGRAASQCSAPPDLLPSEVRVLLQPNTPPSILQRASEPCSKRSTTPVHHQDSKENKQPRLRFEELTCDVELQHPESSKQKPLQFSFTLYDLDGHGRMTKDDIAGIVSTIYDSIGKSVTVPHYGSKTIQVRLTVIPENGQTRCQREKEKATRRRRKQQETPHSAPTHVDNSENEQHERLSHEDDASWKSSCSAGRKPPPQRPPPILRQRPHRHPRRGEHRDRKYTKKRSGSLQRRELLQIIQANMEKNHLSFQASRKPSSSIEEEVSPAHHRVRNRSHTLHEKPNLYHKIKESDNGYLDLASGGDSNLCRYDRYLHAVICSSPKHANTGYHQKQNVARKCQAELNARASHPPNPRSRSHDLASSQQPRVLQIIFL